MGHIRQIEIDTPEKRLRIYATIENDEDTTVRAELPQREVSTLLPRDILLGDRKEITEKLLSTIEHTLRRLLIGRTARVWEYNEQSYFGFPTWRSAKIEDSSTETPSAEPGMDEDSKGR